MVMIPYRRVIMAAVSPAAQLKDSSLISQKIEIPVDRCKTNSRQPLPYSLVKDLGSRMILRPLQFHENKGTLFGISLFTHLINSNY